MAEPSSLLHPSQLPTPRQRNPSPDAPKGSSKFLSSLLYKLAFFVVFVALLPLSPSQAPEFVGETISTGLWELLRLLLVGIAISYGLFGRRNADHDMEKEPPQKAGSSTQSFVSQILHVPSVFDDDEADCPLGGLDESKVQTWSSQYYRNEPVVVVANGGTRGSHAANKPLLLPVRSLKSQTQHSGSSDEVDGVDSRNGSEESAVRPSPIPWRSRSARMEPRDDTGPATPAFDADKGLSRTSSFRLPASRGSPTRPSPSPKRLSPSLSLSPETRVKSSEDTVKKKSNYKPAPPPAPPPPPPFAYLGHGYTSTSERKITARSFKDELKDLSRRGSEGWQRNNGAAVVDPSFEGPPVGRSVRTLRAMDKATTPQPPPVPKYPIEKRNEFMEKVFVSSDDDSECDDEEAAEPSAKAAPDSAPEAARNRNEVDKKADEFIAKFREQIRLQRIESIKKSTGQRSNRKTQQP
ncbi:hypothetical protein B296_00015864 [Ensete ventricosum]|uniref:DUF4408 domain-containing protein n=1 Tax=Ensete ventricosum TaxID=4639 RepID=A0A426Z9J1_ENSVE|nr:hypothetical protein B296_00015864 [Ensete ventricosum]